MNLHLNNKTAFISGSTAGIGFAIAKRLLAEGAEVIINGRSKESIEKAVNELKELVAGARVWGIAADFANAEEVNRLVEQLPQVDILVNNAGIFEPKPFAEIPDEDWYRFFEINVMSGVRLARKVFPEMLERNWGRVIFISSETGLSPASEMVHYGMTKTAQLSVSRGMAELTRGTNVTVNSILPGPTRSRGIGGFLDGLAEAGNITADEVEQNFFRETRPTSLLQRFADVSEIADTVAYFASPLASATNGASIRVDGGILKTIM